MRPILCLAYVVGLALATTLAYAAGCSSLASYIDDARSALQSALDADDISDAQDEASTAASALDDATTAAKSCGCQRAARDFDDAATHARNAEGEDERPDFREELHSAVSAFRDGVTCGWRNRNQAAIGI